MRSGYLRFLLILAVVPFLVALGVTPAHAGYAAACGLTTPECVSVNVRYNHLGCDPSFCRVRAYLILTASGPGLGYGAATMYWESLPGGTDGVLTASCSWRGIGCQTSNQADLFWRRELGCHFFSVTVDGSTGLIQPLALVAVRLEEPISACADGTIRLED